MTDPLARIRRLQSEARAMPPCATQVALLEEAVRLADTLADVELGYGLREALMTAACFASRPEELLVAFAWCLAQSDRDPERFQGRKPLWEYKWAISAAVRFPEIERPRLEQLLADLERRFRVEGGNLHAVYAERRAFLMSLGDRAGARAAQARLRKTRRGSLSHCPACVAHCDVDYFAFQRHWRRALEAAEPILAGRLRCAEVPLKTYNTVLRPLLQLGRHEEARSCQQRGYALIWRAGNYVWELADHLSCVVLLGDLPQAKVLVERHLAQAFGQVPLNERFEFLLATRLWTERLRRQGVDRLKVRLPQGLPAPDAQGRVAVAPLGAWLTNVAGAIARRYDARNGNDYFQQRLDELPKLLKLAVE